MAYGIHIENHIATFTIDRPARRNAISTEVVNGLTLFLDEIESNQDLHFAVITGEGETFCSGGDLAEYHSLRTAEEAYPMLERMAKLLYRIQMAPLPVIALVNGTAVGGGCEIATACDYRLVHEAARAGFIQGTLAITTGWGGGSLLFEKNLPQDRMLALLSAAKIHQAEELLALGWATELYSGTKEEGLQQLLQQFSAIHPAVHRAYKDISKRKWAAGNLYERIMEEVKRCAALWEDEAHHAAVDRFLQKKK